MAETTQTPKRSLSPDWFVREILTKIGDLVDRLLGRGWKPASSLATSELIERLKSLLDAEAKETATKARFVPHNITLKMQWDKFSTDSEAALRTLENELLTAAVDHINDRRYYTYAPLSIEVKPDYFTSGVKLYAGFEKFDETGREAEMNVTIPNMRLDQALLDDVAEPTTFKVEFRFVLEDMPQSKTLEMAEGQRLSVGRTRENSLTIDDPSVSKIHASLTLSRGHNIIVADTGSTNGTFVNDIRIAYGKAVELSKSDRLKLGTVELEFEITPKAVPVVVAPVDDSYKVGDIKFTSRHPDDEDETIHAQNGPRVTPGLPSNDREFTRSVKADLKVEREEKK